MKTDQAAIDDAVRTLRVVTMARTASETFAVNEIGKQTRQAVEQTLEIVTRSLITDLGKAEGAPGRGARIGRRRGNQAFGNLLRRGLCGAVAPQPGSRVCQGYEPGTRRANRRRSANWFRAFSPDTDASLFSKGYANTIVSGATAGHIRFVLHLPALHCL